VKDWTWPGARPAPTGSTGQVPSADVGRVD
jgi:hypothetical protein